MTIISKIKYNLSIILILLSFNLINAQEVNVPIDIQVEILPKILSLNKSFNLDDPNNNIKVGILYSSAIRSSEKVKNEIFRQVKDNNLSIKKAKVVFFPIDLKKEKDIKKYLALHKIDVLYFTPLRGYNISEISKLCKEKKIISFTGVTNFIDNNEISVGFELQDNKLKITINLESAKAEGANFSSRLLAVSKVK